MKKPTKIASPAFWRWVLITSELVVLAELIVIRMAPRESHYIEVRSSFAILAGAALVFLLFGSPFLVRSQRWLAVIGWCLAAAAMLSSPL